MHNIWKGKRGTSLVEILVVMVVLLIGIMTLIQMFPTGFRIVKAGESQTIATRLAQQELERWKTISANLPDSIVAINEAGVVMSDENPTLPFKGWYSVIVKDANGNDVTVYRRGNALNFRQINGEFTLMPALSVLGGLSVSRYALAFGPIEVTRPDATSPWDGIDVKGRDLMRVGINSLAKAGQYKIDYSLNGSAFRIFFPSDRATKRFYYVSYSFWAVAGTGAPELFNVSDQRVDLPGNLPNGSWNAALYDVAVNVPTDYAIVAIEQESDSVARGFYQNTGAFTTDPYEFKLADPVIGIIDFNTYAQGEYESTPLGLQPLAARINYKIYDPRIIHEDRVMPQPPANEHDIPVKMSLRFILNLEDPTDNPNEETYKGLSTTLPMQVYVVDLATGLQVRLPALYLVDIKQGGKLDYKTGIIKVPEVADLGNVSGNIVQSNVPMVGRHLRFYYRAEGDWTVQCQKACASYTKTSDPDNIKYNRYFLQSPNRLLFALCQGEQTVMVDFSYGDPAGGSEHRLSSRAYQIQMDIPSRIGYVDLPVPAEQVIKRISVLGASFRARVLWRDGAVWRKVDLDTTLTPSR